jgi:DHA1 family inner membrane transport protein
MGYKLHEGSPDFSSGGRVNLPLGLYALGLGGAAIGLTEFAIAGLLPIISHDLSVSTAKSGVLVSGYAAAVAVGGVFLTAILGKLDRKKTLAAVMMLFALGNLLSALAHSFNLMLLGRFLSGICHGAFFGIGAVVAVSLVSKERRSTAISIMFGGITVANVLGVPFGAWIGQRFGWRAALMVIVIIALCALLGLIAFLPHSLGSAHIATKLPLKEEIKIFRNKQVWLSLLMTIFGFGGMFGAYTYIVFTLEDISKFAVTTIPSLLLLFGLGVFVGNFFGGKLADWKLNRALSIEMLLLTLTLLTFGLTAHNKVCAIFLLFFMGAFGFAQSAALQMRVMHYAHEAPAIASGANITSFNLGNALGAWLGGWLISLNLGYASPLWGGAAISGVALSAFIVSYVTGRHEESWLS